MLHIGVDEAGYGPLLGPLTIGASAFRIAAPARAAHGGNDPWDVDLRAALAGIVCAARGDAASSEGALPVPIDDSKRIMQSAGVIGLARGVGAFAAALDQAPPADLEDMVHRYSDRHPSEFAAAPWFEGLRDALLPRYPWTGPLADRFAAAGIDPLDLRVLPVDAPELNAAFERTRNKARVLGIYSAALILGILDRYPGEDALVVIDRHGGRKDYGPYLADVFPFARLSPRAAPAGESRYRVEVPGRTLRFRFVTHGDRASLAVSWASMVAKLTRELFMQCMNTWFARRSPGLRPTAGYTTDGRRFLGDVEQVIQGERIAECLLVRSR